MDGAGRIKRKEDRERFYDELGKGKVDASERGEEGRGSTHTYFKLPISFSFRTI